MSNTLPKASNRFLNKTIPTELDGVHSSEEALTLYRKLLLARRCEERIRQEYDKDQMKTPVHLGIGQEAIPVGVSHALPPNSSLFGTYRNHALYLAVTQDTDGFFAELYGKGSGICKGKAGSMHLSAPEQGLLATSAVVGTTLPLAVGSALANSYRGGDAFVAVFFGDGTLEEGVFWESLNFACLKKLRILFVCEDNGLAIHTPTAERVGFKSVSQVLDGFDCHFAGGTGWDLIDVVTQTRRMMRIIEEQPKPGFLHFPYFRFLEHVGVREDFDAGYRRRPTSEERERLDPVSAFEKWLATQEGVSQHLQAIEAQVAEQIERSVRAAQQAPFAPSSELFTDVRA